LFVSAPVCLTFSVESKADATQSDYFH
jgi:hypothetical protein